MSTTIKEGDLLLSEPFMPEPKFSRAGILLCKHNEEGSLGFIINKPIKMAITDLIKDFPEFDSEVYYGGPVATDSLQFLHTKGDILDGSEQIIDGLWWGGEFEKLKFLINSGLITPKDIRFFLGYSGWSRGQLKSEMEVNSWFPTYMDINYLFMKSPHNLWAEAMRRKGNYFSVVAQLRNEKHMWN